MSPRPYIPQMKIQLSFQKALIDNIDRVASAPPVIECASVHKIFGDNAQALLRKSDGKVDARAFQDAGCIIGVNKSTIEVHRGERLVVMGLSGSGKSTLLRCISRLAEPPAGKIFIDGEDPTQMSGKQLIDLRRNKMGMIFQSFALLPHKTVLENIAFPLQVKGQSTASSIKRAMEMVELVSLGGRKNYYPRSCRVASGSASVLPGLWPSSRRSGFWTIRFRRWIR